MNQSRYWKTLSLDSLPDAIATNCSKCTEKQRIGSEQVTHYLIDNQPEEWDQLGAIYDKDGEYKQNYIESKMRDQATESSASIADGKMEGEEDGNKFENGPKDETNDENKQEWTTGNNTPIAYRNTT